MEKPELKARAIALRKNGKTYTEIVKVLQGKVSKSILTRWLHDVQLGPRASRRIRERRESSLKRARAASLNIRKKQRESYLGSLYERNEHLSKLLDNLDVAKIALIVLYLGEGTKNPARGLLTFGNADASVIRLFLRLLRKCYKVEEKKFRCTVQCRSDQNTEELKKFWSSMTGIPPSQFYKARVDPRTIGVVSRNKNYKGVCRLDYFSAYVFNDLLKGIEVLTKGR